MDWNETLSNTKATICLIQNLSDIFIEHNTIVLDYWTWIPKYNISLSIDWVWKRIKVDFFGKYSSVKMCGMLCKATQLTPSLIAHKFEDSGANNLLFIKLDCPDALINNAVVRLTYFIKDTVTQMCFRKA